LLLAMSREKNLAPGKASAAAAIRVDASGHIVAILQGLGMSLAIASYKASVVILASAAADGLSVLPRSFDKPMGLAPPATGSPSPRATRR
jgi:hypothetical protein